GAGGCACGLRRSLTHARHIPMIVTSRANNRGETVGLVARSHVAIAQLPARTRMHWRYWSALAFDGHSRLLRVRGVIRHHTLPTTPPSAKDTRKPMDQPSSPWGSCESCSSRLRMTTSAQGENLTGVTRKR